jgi:hypothetical protein
MMTEVLASLIASFCGLAAALLVRRRGTIGVALALIAGLCRIALRAPQGDNAMMVPSLTLPREDAMQPFRLMALLALVAFGVPAPAMAQDFYAGKTLKIIVGLEAGGTVDTMARLFVSYLRRHIPGNPLVVIQNMPSAAGVGATNFVYEKAEPDGLTILFNSWDPLAQVLGDQGMRARYENFEYVGGVGDIRVIYGRTDMVPGGLKRPADIMKADNPILGSLNYTNQSGLLPHRQRRLPGDAAWRGQHPLDLDRDLSRAHCWLHQVRRGRRHRVSGAGRQGRALSTQRADHRDAGVP